MSNTIENFLVGLGFSYDEKGATRIGSGIDSIKSKALQLGAVVAGAFGLKAMTMDFASSYDEIGKFSQIFNVAANDVSAMGRAIENEGGTLSSLLSQLEGIERLRAGLLVGDAGFIARVGISGIDPDIIINAENATDAYAALADQFANLSGKERLNAASALGLDEASIRLLSRGRAEFEQLIEQQKRIRPVTDEMTEASATFNRQLNNAMNNTGGFADRISASLLPELNALLIMSNQWTELNRDFINAGLDDFLEIIADNFLAISAALGLIAASGAFASMAGLAGLPLVGSLLAGAGAVGLATTGVAAAGVAGYATGTAINSQFIEGNHDLEEQIGRSVAFVLAGLGSDRAASALQREASQPIRAASALQREASQPIRVQLMLDGKVLDDRTMNILGNETRKAIADISSNTGG